MGRERRDDGRGDAVITKVVFPGQGSPIALWMCCPCDLLKCGKLNGIICASGGTAFTVSPEEKQKKGETIVEQREPGRDVLDWGLGGGGGDS